MIDRLHCYRNLRRIPISQLCCKPGQLWIDTWMRIELLVVCQRKRRINRHETLYTDDSWYGLNLMYIRVKAGQVCSREGSTRRTDGNHKLRVTLLCEILGKSI